MVQPFSSKRLMGARHKRALTREETVQLIGKAGFKLTAGTLQNWERGWFRTPAAALPFLAKVYRCKMETFYGPDPKRTRDRNGRAGGSVPKRDSG